MVAEQLNFVSVFASGALMGAIAVVFFIFLLIGRNHPVWSISTGVLEARGRYPKSTRVALWMLMLLFWLIPFVLWFTQERMRWVPFGLGFIAGVCGTFGAFAAPFLASRALPGATPNYHDIQAIVRSGFGRLDEAVFLLLRITDVDRAKSWLAAVSEAAGAGTLSYRVNSRGRLGCVPIARAAGPFTAAGLKKLGLPELLFQDGSTHAFPREFRLGMAGEGLDREGRSRRLGDVGVNAPSNWEWAASRRRFPMPSSCFTPKRAVLQLSSRR